MPMEHVIEYKCMKYDSDILHSFFETDQNAKFDWLREGWKDKRQTRQLLLPRWTIKNKVYTCTYMYLDRDTCMLQNECPFPYILYTSMTLNVNAS